VLAAARGRIVPLEAKLVTAMRALLHDASPTLDRLELGARACLARERQTMANAGPALANAMRARLLHARHGLSSLAAQLDALSPLAVLQRGYAIATDREGRAVLAAATVAPGDPLTVRFHHGTAYTEVVRIDPEA
jgi:exodeoxyribonuclease VII large subunit